MAATPIPRYATASLPNFSRYKFDPPAGSVLKYKAGQGYYTVPKVSGKVVQSTATPQNSFTTIETPAQIEERVKRMTQEAISSQQTQLESAADKLKKEAEQRRVSLQGAYEAAARANAAMGTGAQATWNTAASTLQGLASTASGGVADALQRDLATQEEALARVGAGGTGFDARSQAGVESYRGGFLPAEMFTRSGALQKNYLEDQAKALNLRGVQEGTAAEEAARYKINSDLQSQIGELTAGRSKYETDLRSQLLGARADQIKEEQDAREYNASLSLKKVQIEQAQQKIDLQYQEARAKATTTAQKFELDKWYKSQNLILSQARNDIASQRVGIAQQNADTATTRATNATKANGGKPPSASTISMTVQRAKTAGTDALTKEMTRILAKQPKAHAPKGTTQKDYAQTPEFQAAKAAAAHDASIHFFGDIMYRVIESMNDHLKGLGWSKNQIKKAAYELVSQTIPAPRAWLQKNPGFGPKV